MCLTKNLDELNWLCEDRLYIFTHYRTLKEFVDSRLNTFIIMDLQYISDPDGRQTAVVIPIDEWHSITAKHQDLKSLETPRRKPSDFRGAISKKTADELLRYTEQARKEWESGLS